MDRAKLLDRLAAICGAPDIREFYGTATSVEFATATFWPRDLPSLDACVHAVDGADGNAKPTEIRKGWLGNPRGGAGRYGWHVVVFCDLDEARRIR